mmetsp:Transcript_1019/g.2117  ORF Transcript_1019/g.2117 Transcript_1019/m.2117 type:complete len:689 (+) Transcript_1019:4715-6781(+)
MEALELDELEAALGGQRELPDGEARLQVHVHVRVLEQLHQRTEDAHALADAVIRLVRGDVVQPERNAAPGLEVVARGQRQQRHDGAGVEELLVVLALNRQVADAEAAVARHPGVLLVAREEHELVHGARAEQGRLRVALRGEEGEAARHLAPDLGLGVLGQVEDRPEAPLLEHAPLRATLDHLGDVGERRDGVDLALAVLGLGEADQRGEDARARHGDLVLLRQGQVAQRRRDLALDLDGLGRRRQDERLERALTNQLHADRLVGGQAAEGRHRLELHVGRRVGGRESVGDDGLEAARLDDLLKVLVVGAEVAQREDRVLAAFDVAVLGEVGEGLEAVVHEELVVVVVHRQVGEREQAEADGLVVGPGLGVERHLADTLHWLQDVIGDHLLLVPDVGRQVAQRHRGHALAKLVLRAHERQQVGLRPRAQDHVAVDNVRREVAEPARRLALHLLHGLGEGLHERRDAVAVDNLVHVLHHLREVGEAAAREPRRLLVGVADGRDDGREAAVARDVDLVRLGEAQAAEGRDHLALDLGLVGAREVEHGLEAALLCHLLAHVRVLRHLDQGEGRVLADLGVGDVRKGDEEREHALLHEARVVLNGRGQIGDREHRVSLNFELNVLGAREGAEGLEHARLHEGHAVALLRTQVADAESADALARRVLGEQVRDEQLVAAARDDRVAGGAVVGR